MDANEQSFRLKYPFANLSTVLIPKLLNNVNNYDYPSCILAERICRAGMNTCDLLNASQPTSVSLLLNNLWNMFWNSYITFSAIANTATGKNAMVITSDARTVLNIFTNWDEVLQPSPFPDAGIAFYSVLQGVSP